MTPPDKIEHQREWLREEKLQEQAAKDDEDKDVIEGEYVRQPLKLQDGDMDVEELQCTYCSFTCRCKYIHTVITHSMLVHLLADVTLYIKRQYRLVYVYM